MRGDLVVDRSARDRARDRPHHDLAVAHPHEQLRARPDEGVSRHGREEHVRRRVALPQPAVDVDRVGVARDAQLVADLDLVDVADRDVPEAFPDPVHERRPVRVVLDGRRGGRFFPRELRGTHHGGDLVDVQVVPERAAVQHQFRGGADVRAEHALVQHEVQVGNAGGVLDEVRQVLDVAGDVVAEERQEAELERRRGLRRVEHTLHRADQVPEQLPVPQRRAVEQGRDAVVDACAQRRDAVHPNLARRHRHADQRAESDHVGATVPVRTTRGLQQEHLIGPQPVAQRHGRGQRVRDGHGQSLGGDRHLLRHGSPLRSWSRSGGRRSGRRASRRRPHACGRGSARPSS